MDEQKDENEKKAGPLKHILFALLITGLIAGGYWRIRNQGQDIPSRGRTVELQDKPGAYKQAIDVMGTVATVQFFEEDRAANLKAAETVWRVFDEVNERFSNYRADSELSRLNREAFNAPFKCSPEMWELLEYSRHAHKISHGAFDISAGPLVKLWGIYRRTRKTLPSDEEIAEAKARVGLDKVIFDDKARTVKFTVDGMYLDVGGIAKGYALDQAVAEVRRLNIERGIIDLGGNLICLDKPVEGRETYSIGIRNPLSPHGSGPIGVTKMLGKAIATSGDYERYVEIDGKRYAHIMDVRTGKPVTGMASVTVVATKGVVTDMLSTAIFINNGKYLEELRKLYPELKVLIIRKPQNEPPEMSFYPVGKPWAEVDPVESWAGDAE